MRIAASALRRIALCAGDMPESTDTPMTPSHVPMASDAGMSETMEPSSAKRTLPAMTEEMACCSHETLFSAYESAKLATSPARPPNTPIYAASHRNIARILPSEQPSTFITPISLVRS